MTDEPPLADVLAEIRKELDVANAATTADAELMARLRARSLLGQHADRILAAAERGDGEPDHCYDADDWDETLPWEQRDSLPSVLGRPGDWMEVGCLKELPPRWAVCVSGKNGLDIRWFDSEDEAKALAEAAQAPNDA